MTEQTQTNTTQQPPRSHPQGPHKKPFPKRNKSFSNRNQFKRRPTQPTVEMHELNAMPVERKTAHIRISFQELFVLSPLVE